MTAVLYLEPPARQLITLAAGVTDDMLQAPTPCDDYTVADRAVALSGRDPPLAGPLSDPALARPGAR